MGERGKFPLEGLLKLRTRQEDAARNALAALAGEQAARRERIEQLRAEVQGVSQRLREMLLEGDSAGGAACRERIAEIQVTAARETAEVARWAGRLEQARETFAEARGQRQAVDLLRQRFEAAMVLAGAKREQRENEEIAGANHAAARDELRVNA
ncbi:MAG TPA: flagellar export protein FliJ [Phycisphaerales bacterium]|nr:flagellar export protein FliJ [Phycisphaerales bacterium]